MKEIKPLGDRILVKRRKPVTSKGGIFLPESAQEKPKEGEVISTGPGSLNDDGVLQPMSVRKGDTILFSSYAGTEVKQQDADEEYLILSEKDVLGVLQK